MKQKKKNPFEGGPNGYIKTGDVPVGFIEK